MEQSGLTSIKVQQVTSFAVNQNRIPEEEEWEGESLEDKKEVEITEKEEETLKPEEIVL